MLLAMWAGPAACFKSGVPGALGLRGPSLCPARAAGALLDRQPSSAIGSQAKQQRARGIAVVRGCAAASPLQAAAPREIRSSLGRLVVQMAVIASTLFAFAPMQAQAKVSVLHARRFRRGTHARTHALTHARTITHVRTHARNQAHTPEFMGFMGERKGKETITHAHTYTYEF
jgi:cytochrome c-type biogenesis protein CcmH/NrfG